MTSPYGGSRLGTRFGPYELHSLIGVGGMGEVYRAYDTVKERMVAVKLLRAEMAADSSYQERFRRESRVAARLQEPHVIPVHDFGDIEGVALYRHASRRGRQPEGRAARERPARAGASCVDHRAGGGGSGRRTRRRPGTPRHQAGERPAHPDDFAYLVDFGIAHDGGDASVTKTGLIIGSCAYMAAERFSGGQVGPPADVYSLTCLLYECLTGRPPFEAGDLRQLMSAHMFSPPPRPSIMRRGITRAFDDVIAQGMAKKPEDRFASAGELAKAASAAAGFAQPPRRSPSRSEPAVEHEAVLGGLPESGRDGLHPVPDARSHTRAAACGSRVSARHRWRWRRRRSLLFGVAVVLAAAVGLRRPQQQPFASDHAGCAAPEHDDRDTAPSTPLNHQLHATTPTTPSPSTSSTVLAGMQGTDEQGFVGHAARCDAGSSPVAMIRTALSLVVICETTPGSYYYHGERLRDGANVQLANATPLRRWIRCHQPG